MTALKFSSTTWSCRKTRIRYWFMAILIGWTPGGVFDFGVPRVRNLVPPNLHLLGIPPMVLQVDDFWESHLLMDRLPASWRASEDQLGTSMCFLLLIVKILFFFVVCSCFWPVLCWLIESSWPGGNEKRYCWPFFSHMMSWWWGWSWVPACIWVYAYKIDVLYICTYTRHVARTLAFATQSAMLSCQLVLHAPSFMPFSFIDLMLIGLCPHLLLCLIYKTHLLRQFLIEAMDIKQPESQESQELPEASPPHPPQATLTTSPTTAEALIAEELELIRQHWATTRESSPASKPRTDQGWEEFLTALSAKDVEPSDLDFGLQQELRSSFTSSQSRLPCPQPHLSRSTSLRPWQGKLQKIDLTKKWPFTDLQQVETPTLEHPRAVQHSHSDRHHGYQIEDIGIHDWQQSTPTSRTTSYRIYSEQPRLEYLSTWRTRTQISTWTFHKYSAALPSLPDRHRSHHRCTSMQHSSYKDDAPSVTTISTSARTRGTLLGSSFELTNILEFDYIVDQLTSFINNSYLFQDIFLGMCPCGPTPTMSWRTWVQLAPVSPM